MILSEKDLVSSDLEDQVHYAIVFKRETVKLVFDNKDILVLAYEDGELELFFGEYQYDHHEIHNVECFASSKLAAQAFVTRSRSENPYLSTNLGTNK